MSIVSKQTNINTPKANVSDKATAMAMHIPCTAVIPDTTISQRCLGVVYNITANWDTGSSLIKRNEHFSNISKQILAHNRPVNDSVDAKSRFSYPVHRVGVKNDEGITQATTYINTSSDKEQNVYIKTRDTLPFVVKPTDIANTPNKIIKGFVEGYKVFDAKELKPEHLYVVKSIPVMKSDLSDLYSYINVKLNRKSDDSVEFKERTFEDLYTSTAKKHIEMLRDMVDSYKEQIKEHKSTIASKLNPVSESDYAQADDFSTLGVVYVVYEILIEDLNNGKSTTQGFYLHNLDIMVSLKKFNHFDEHPAHSVIRSGFTPTPLYMDKVTPQLNTGIHYTVEDTTDVKPLYYIDVDTVYALKPVMRHLSSDSDTVNAVGDCIEIHRSHYNDNFVFNPKTKAVKAEVKYLSVEKALESFIVFKTYDEAAAHLSKRAMAASVQEKELNNSIAVLDTKQALSDQTLLASKSSFDNEIRLANERALALQNTIERERQQHQFALEMDKNKLSSTLAENEVKFKENEARLKENELKLEKSKAEVEKLQASKQMLDSEREHLKEKQYYAASTARSESISATWKIVPAVVVSTAALVAAYHKFSD